ncbi:MAG: nucleotidyltransferase domain-containing protein [Acidimicrobiia bacterium]|nr:nucleotidyltransferase domain-containing protein [Acidimicrobiia bacterium]
MTHPVVAARRRQQAELIERVREWAAALDTRVPGVVAVVVFGSVARGDFNKWSDTDVLVVADELPADHLARAEVLAPVPPGVQPVAWTRDELHEARRKRNPIARESDEIGVCVHGSLPA